MIFVDETQPRSPKVNSEGKTPSDGRTVLCPGVQNGTALPPFSGGALNPALRSRGRIPLGTPDERLPGSRPGA